MALAGSPAIIDAPTNSERCELPALIAPLVLLLTLTGCNPDDRVFFQNNTDQILYVHPRQPDPGVMPNMRIEPNRTTPMNLVDDRGCSTFYVITDKDGNLVKDPGQICWHDTVTIP